MGVCLFDGELSSMQHSCPGNVVRVRSDGAEKTNANFFKSLQVWIWKVTCRSNIDICIYVVLVIGHSELREGAKIFWLSSIRFDVTHRRNSGGMTSTGRRLPE